MASIIDQILSGTELSQDEIHKLKSKIRLKSIGKGMLVQSKGDFPVKLYFVKKGLLRSYVTDVKGREHIFMFAPEGWIIADNLSLVLNMPCDLYIDAIEPSEIEVCDKDFLELDFANGSDLRLSGMERISRRLAVLQKRVIMLMSATALERYHHFIETYPNIVQRVPQKMIASYLGITPEALSKIRGDMARKS